MPCLLFPGGSFCPKSMGKLKMYLITLLILEFSLISFADEIGSNIEDPGTSDNFSEASLIVTLEEENLSSGDRSSDYSDIDLLTTKFTFATSTPTLVRAPNLKPLINHSPENFVGAFISTIRESEKGNSKDTAVSSQHNDELKNINPTFPDTNSEPKTMLKSFSDKIISSSSKSAVHESASLPSKDSILRSVTPPLQHRITQTGFENNNSGQHFNNYNISLNDFKDIKENVTFPTESQTYSAEPILSTDDFLSERNGENSQLYSVTGSSEITSPFYEMNFSDNDNTSTTVKVFESHEHNKVYTTNELSIDITTPNGQNEENIDLFLSKRQNKSASIDYQQQDSNFLPSSVTPPYLSLSSNSELPDLSMYTVSVYDITVTASANETSRKTDSTLKSEVATESTSTTLVSQETSYKDWSEPSNVDSVVIEDRTVVIKKDEEYTIGFSKVCSNSSSVNRLLHLLNSLPNSKMTNFTCKDLKDMKLSIKSKELFNKFTELLKAEIKDMVFIKFHPNATLTFEIDSLSSYDGIFIPNLAVMIVGSVMLFILIIISCAVLYKMKCCRHKHSTSLDLHHIPHLNLKTDYNLTPIPRPSISFSDNSRDFLHAQDSCNRSRKDSTLNKRKYSNAMMKTYEDVAKEIRSKQEMQTFTMRSGRKSEFRASANQDNAPSQSRDRMQEKSFPRKYGVDNPLFKKW